MNHINGIERNLVRLKLAAERLNYHVTELETRLIDAKVCYSIEIENKGEARDYFIGMLESDEMSKEDFELQWSEDMTILSAQYQRVMNEFQAMNAELRNSYYGIFKNRPDSSSENSNIDECKNRKQSVDEIF